MHLDASNASITEEKFRVNVIIHITHLNLFYNTYVCMYIRLLLLERERSGFL